LHYIDSTEELTIYNNTLYADADQRTILEIVYYPNSTPGTLPGKLRLNNNIIYKNQSNSALVLLKFGNIDTSTINGAILNNNLYFIESYPSSLYKTAFGNYDTTNGYTNEFTVNWNYNWEDKGRSGNPQFISSIDLRLQYHSKAKNIGKGLYNDISKDYEGKDRPYWNADFDAGAFEIEDTQLKIGVSGFTGDDDITHSVQVVDTYWERNSSGNWVVSSDQQLSSANFSTTGNSDTANISSLRGFQYKWLGQIESYPGIGTGLYKVSNDSSTAHFYIDLRDAVQDYSLNVYILYRNDLKEYYYYKNGHWNNPITSGSVVRIWELNDGTTNTQNLPSYWQHVLIPLEKNNHPYLVWGPNDNIGSLSQYQVYRKNGGLPLELILSASLDTMEYLDEAITLNTPPLPGHKVYYYVTAVGELTSSNSDTVNYEAQGNDPGKAAGKFSPVFAYSMEQNYPNPFNPSTKVSFSIEKEEHVTLKVYDILGREVKTLINQVLLPGNHQVDFNGDNLSSGIYICKLTSGEFTALKKMQLLK
jgi:hypothetical protein